MTPLTYALYFIYEEGVYPFTQNYKNTIRAEYSIMGDH